MLDERKRKVLSAVVTDYIASAEPVGSRTIARKYDFGVSPATIRKEMADLEMLGYLEHIHTSSGRVPSSKGYRLYVDNLLPPQEMRLSDEDKKLIDSWYKAKVKRVDEVFKETARIISRVTNNVSLLLAPQMSQAAYRCLQFLPLDESRAIAVLMTDAGFVENRIIDIPDGASFDDLRRVAGVFNDECAGYAIDALHPQCLAKIRQDVGDESLYEAALDVINRSLEGEKKERLYLGGTTQMLAQPEFQDVEKVKETLIMLEEEQLLKDILHAHRGEGLSVTIGSENKYDGVKDMSIITATYHLGGELLGTLAVMGPTRMEYGKAISMLNYMNDHIAEIIKQFRW